MLNITIDLEKSEAPKGFCFTGEYRIPKEGEYFLSPGNSKVYKALGRNSRERMPILDRVRFSPAENQSIYYLDPVSMRVTNVLYDPLVHSRFLCFETGAEAERIMPHFRSFMVDLFIKCEDEG